MCAAVRFGQVCHTVKAVMICKGLVLYFFLSARKDQSTCMKIVDKSDTANASFMKFTTQQNSVRWDPDLTTLRSEFFS